MQDETNRVKLAVSFLFNTLVLHVLLPVYQLDIGVTLDQHEAAPVLQQRGQGRVGDTALDGAVASVVARCVEVFGNGPAHKDPAVVTIPNQDLLNTRDYLDSAQTKSKTRGAT